MVFGVEAVEAQHFLAGGFVAGDRVSAGERRYPLAEGARGSEAAVKVLAIVVVGIVVVPAAEVFAGRRKAGHLAQRLKQAIFAEGHQHGMRVHELRFVQIAGEDDVAIAELREQRH